MRRNWLHSLVCVWTTGAVAGGGCRTAPVVVAPQKPVGTLSSNAAPAPLSGGRATVSIVTDEPEGKLTATVASARSVSPDVKIATLSGPETQALLARMEPLPDLGGRPAPTLRAPSLAPPRTGNVLPIAFVKPSGKAIADLPISQAPAVGVALTPPQILPVGEVQAESEIRVRFEEPMVAVAAVGKNPPTFATITPPIAGTWRWVDTRVAQFTPTNPRLPQATTFEIKIAAGLRSITGATLTEPQTGTFSTPSVMIRGLYPTVTLRPDSPVLVQLDQKVDPAAIAKLLRVEIRRKNQLFTTMSLADARARWAKNPSVELDQSKLSGSFVIIAPKTAWPAGARVRVVLGKNAPSLEGPRLSAQETAGDFDVAKAFVTVGVACDGNRARISGAVCSANGYLDVTLSNAIDPKTYSATKIQIEGRKIDDHTPSYERVSLQTPGQVGRSFVVAIQDGVTDVYGQPLGGAKRLPFSTGKEIYTPYVSARDGLYILDPRFDIPQWVLHMQAIAKLGVELYQVQPSDYFAFQDYEQGKRATPPGKRIYQKEHTVGARWAATARIDLRPALSAAGTGHVIAIAKATPATMKIDPYEKKRVAWIQVSKLGLTARIDGQRVNTWTHDITPASFMKPIPGVATSLIVERRNDAPAAVTTDADGHATYELLPYDEKKVDDYPTSLLVAKSGTDSAFTAITGRSQKALRHDQARWYVTDDRFTYKPGETVYVKGWVRWTHDDLNPGLSVPASGDTIAWSLADSRGNKIGSGSAAITPQGGFDLEAVLPANANLGTASFSFSTKKQSIRHPISIEEFRTPAYAVTLNDDVTHAGATPLVVGESIEMSTEAKYYAGGGLAGSRIKWDATLHPATYRPAGWDRYTFRPAPQSKSAVDDEDGYYYRGGGTSASQESSLSGDSTSGIVFGLAAVPGGEPSVLEVDATVTDIDRQTIRASSRKILVHPSTLYVGVRQLPDSWDRLQLIVTDIDGNLVPGVPIDAAIEGVLGSERYRAGAEVQDRQYCKLVSGTEPVTCGYKRKDIQFAYSVVARITDSRKRPNSVQYALPWYGQSDPDFAVVPDKKLYKPGDIAKLEIKSKLVPATAVVSFARQGVIVQKRIALATESATVELPITESYVQNVFVVVDRVAQRRHQTSGSTLPLPEQSSTELSLPVDVESVRLDMRTRPLQPLVEPGEQASFEVEVKHADKAVAGAEVALLVVDEAVLALSAKTHADPLAPFYRNVDDGTWVASNLSMVDDSGNELAGTPGFERWNLDAPENSHGGGTGSGYGYGSGRGSMGGRSASSPSIRIGSTSVVKARKDFRATAVFSPTLVTDEHGKVRVTVKMPDSLTRFRIVALATAKTYYFGKAESNIVTQRKINARTVAPRFLTQGDSFSLPIVVQNLDRQPRTIDVAVRAANLVGTGPAAKRLTVPGGQRAEVRFDFSTKARGRALIQVISVSSGLSAVSNAFADASNVELQVYEPATTESFATYGNLDDKPSFERLDVPADIFADVGGVEAEVSSTQLQALTDAFWYLYAYPYECAEQRSSRMLATSAMYDILEAFSTPGRPSRKELEEQRTLDLKRLTKDQMADGGWGYFSSMKSDPFVSMQVLSALAAQKQKGTTVQNAIGFVEKQLATRLPVLEAKVKKTAGEPVTLDVPTDTLDVQLSAAALSTLGAAGVDVTARAVRLHKAALALHAYPIDAKARLLALLAGKPQHKAIRDKLVTELISAVHETAAAATVTAKFVEAERMLLVSNTKTTALVVDALLRESPQHALIVKLARGLLDSRQRGRWMTTQENLHVLQALRRYFDVYEKDTPNYTGKLWFGTAAYAEQAFVGRSNARATTSLDWSTLAPGSAHDVTLQKTGTGRMYYRIGITYAPKQTVLPPLDAGFVVKRSYKAVDDPSDVVLRADGRWKIKLGARVLVQIEAINTSLRHSVALVDPLPAGFEPVNTNLATSERAAVDDTADRWDHLNMRDNRSEAFQMYMVAGSHRFSYTARASTPGTFLAAPAKAEEMYSPETFGRSSGTTVVIE